MGFYYAKSLSLCFSYHAKRQGVLSVKQQLAYKYTEITTLLATEALIQFYATKAFLKFAF